MQYSFEKLGIWHLGIRITRETYRITRSFPKNELWGLTSQMRRASTSVSLNIAEGSSRRSKKDFALYLRRSIGSLLELITGLRIALQEEYIPAEEAELLSALRQEEYFKIIAFEKKLLK